MARWGALRLVADTGYAQHGALQSRSGCTTPDFCVAVAACPPSPFLSLGDAIRLGVTIAWATACDLYYGVYCLMLATGYLTARVVHLRRMSSPALGSLLIRALDILAICVVGLVAALLVRQGWQFAFLGRTVQVRTLYNPLLMLTTLMLLRIALRYRPAIGPVTGRQLTSTVRFAMGAGLIAALLLSPLVFPVGEQVKTGHFVRPKIFWRSSPPGIDLLAGLIPNPNHRWRRPRYANGSRG